MIVKLLPLILFITIEPSGSSLVIDSARQTGLHVSDYCPNMKFCREGSHVMCMYYNPNKEFGPRCSNPVSNTKISADVAGQILDVVNTIRSKIALGKETGREGKLLPRGYGIFRLKWDSELATFAQVMANQCLNIHDLCRATKRFSGPSQVSSVMRFVWDWSKPVIENDTISAMTNAKLVYAVTRALKNWYTSKIHITEDMLKVCPDFVALQEDIRLRNARSYISMIQGKATHMGCGISLYNEYRYTGDKNKGASNSLQLVCNFSHGYHKGTESYEMFPPIPNQGYSAKCGCPPGSKEDTDCLCIEATPPPPPKPKCPFGENSGNDYDSTLVLLPIFTIEDAPPQKLYQAAEEIKDPLKDFILQRVDNTSNTISRQGNAEYMQSQLEMMDFFQKKVGQNGLWQRAHGPLLSKSPAPSYTNLYEEPQASPVDPPPPPPRRVPAVRPSPPARSVPRHRIPPPPPPRMSPPPPPSEKFNKETRSTASHNMRNWPLPKLPSKRRGLTKKASIFTRVAQFQLPNRRSIASSTKIIKKDVAPRKDFSNLNKVVNDYLKRRPGYQIIDKNNEQYKAKEETKLRTEVTTQTEALVFDTGLNNAEETVINFNANIGQKNNSNYNDKDVDVKDDNDNKLLSLLDTLEREVRHIALDGSEKELFDAKIRKIYGSIVGKTAVLKFPKPILLNTADQETPEIDFGETRSNVNLELEHEEDNHIKIPEDYSQLKRYKVDKGIGRLKNSITSIQGHKWKTKFIDSFDQKKYKENIDGFSYTDRKPSDALDSKYNNNLDYMYGDINNKHMDDLDIKYKENINKKYSENHLYHEYNDDKVKLSDNFNRQHHYDLNRKYDDNELSSRSKYVADRAVFRKLEHSSRSQEDTTPKNYRYKDLKDIHSSPDTALITKDREKRKKNERKHRNRVKSLNSRKEPIDPLSLERRKYYQEKLDSIKRKLRSRRNRGNNDPTNERSLRRMQTKSRETSRTRPKSQADNFYMPERARFLHGF